MLAGTWPWCSSSPRCSPTAPGCTAAAGPCRRAAAVGWGHVREHGCWLGGAAVHRHPNGKYQVGALWHPLKCAAICNTNRPAHPARPPPALPAGRRLHFLLRRCYGDGGDWQVGLSGAAVRRWSHVPAGPAAAHTKAGLPQASSQLCPMTRAPHLQHTTHSHCSLAVASPAHACAHSCMCARPTKHPLHLPLGALLAQCEVHSHKTCCFSTPPASHPFSCQ